jgi:hypothetical protein
MERIGPATVTASALRLNASRKQLTSAGRLVSARPRTIQQIRDFPHSRVLDDTSREVRCLSTRSAR